MHKFPEIPVVGIGPGSQPGDPDTELAVMAMPSGMQTYDAPLMPEPEDAVDCAAGCGRLEQVLAALQSWTTAKPPRLIGLGGLDAANLDFVSQAFGEGEVSVRCDGPAPILAQESQLAGVWRVQHLDTHGRVVRDTIEVGDVPHMVRSLAFTTARSTLDTAVDAGDSALQNSPALLVELADRVGGYQPGDAPHTVNLSLLPLTEGDVMLLGERLGVGAVTLLSRGYGNCRIGSTALNNVWWIKYFNSQDRLILNTIEVVDVPAVALAAAEDISDSAERLDEILVLYR